MKVVMGIVHKVQQGFNLSDGAVEHFHSSINQQRFEHKLFSSLAKPFKIFGISNNILVHQVSFLGCDSSVMEFFKH